MSTPSIDTLAQDLRDAEEAAGVAAAKVNDGGSCCLDFVVLRLTSWAGLDDALNASGVSWYAREGRRRESRRREIAINPKSGGQASKTLAACEAFAKLMRERGWTAYVFYLVD